MFAFLVEELYFMAYKFYYTHILESYGLYLQSFPTVIYLMLLCDFRYTPLNPRELFKAFSFADFPI